MFARYGATCDLTFAQRRARWAPLWQEAPPAGGYGNQRKVSRDCTALFTSLRPDICRGGRAGRRSGGRRHRQAAAGGCVRQVGVRPHRGRCRCVEISKDFYHQQHVVNAHWPAGLIVRLPDVHSVCSCCCEESHAVCRLLPHALHPTLVTGLSGVSACDANLSSLDEQLSNSGLAAASCQLPAGSRQNTSGERIVLAVLGNGPHCLPHKRPIPALPPTLNPKPYTASFDHE